MTINIKIDKQINRIKRIIEELEIAINWNNSIHKATKAEEDLGDIYDKLKEIK